MNVIFIMEQGSYYCTKKVLNNYFKSQMGRKKIEDRMKKLLLFILIITFNYSFVYAAAISSTSTGGLWNSTGTWSGGVIPGINDDVTIAAGATVSVSDVENCKTLTFTSGGGSSVVNLYNGSTAGTLWVGTNATSGSIIITISSPGNKNINTLDVGIGTLNANSTCEILISGSTGSGSNHHTGLLSVSTGTANVGYIVMSSSSGSDAPYQQITFTGAGTMNIGIVSATNAGIGANGTLTLATGCTVNYNASGNQIVGGYVYNNLILSGSGVKTSTSVTVNGVFSMEGTATASAAPTYGSAATLQYNTATSRTAGVEWITPFAATGGVIIANTGTITMNAAKVLNSSVPLTINSGAFLNTGNYQLTFGGDFVNNGTFTAGSSPITLDVGTATQSISGFTTTGLVSMTKSGGTATFTGNVNGAGLTINGSGGTLNLGTGLTHTFTGDVTLTAGTLNGGSSTLNANNASSSAWNGTGTVFTAGTGTVNFGALGSQTLSATTTTFNAVTFSGSGTKTLGSATTANGTLTINSGVTLATGNNSVTFGGNFSNSGTFTAGSSPIVITSTLASQTISGFTTTGLVSMTKTGGTATFQGNVSGAGLTINGTGGTLNLGTGLTHTFTGDVTLTAGTLNGGSSILNEDNNSATAWNGTGTVFSAGTGTVVFGAAGTQTLTASATTFNNLTFSNTSVKTITTANVTVNGVLSMEGTATLSAAPTFGAAAKLQYNTTTGRTAGSEWITPFAATGGVYITSTGVITANAAKVFNASVPLVINTGGSLNTGNFQLTFGGNFSNSGTFTAGSSPVVIANTMAAQTISGFTTTGLVSMTKTGGTATLQGNVSGAGLTINGSGGTLNLGTGLTHTFTGDVTLTAGTLSGGSSILNENNVSGTAWNGTGTVFSAGTGTVVFGAAGAQTLTASATTFNNLTMSNSGVKTITTANVTVNGVLSMEGTATVSANPTYGSAATLQYNTSTGRTVGSEWITPFTATGGVVIANTGAITLNGAKVFNSSAPLKINSGSSLAMSTFLLTLNGNLVNNGGTTSGSGGVTITGTANQSIGSFTNTGLLTINKSSGLDSLVGDVSCGSLTLTSGNLILANNNLTISTTAAISSSSTNYVVTDGTGQLIQNVSTTPVTFPVGPTATKYNPIILTNTGNADNYKVRVNQNTSGFTGSNYVSDQWIVSAATNNGTSGHINNLTLKLQWNGTDEHGGARTNYKIGVFLTSQFDIVVSNGAAGSNPYTIQNTNTFGGSGYDMTGGKTFSIAESGSLPVEISSFVVIPNGRNINLNWETQTEKNSNMFYVERSEVNKNSWETVGSVRASVLSNSPKYYSYTETNLQAGKYQYRLKMLDNDFTYQYSSVVAIEVALPSLFTLNQNYPNPFNPSTKISYNLPFDAKVTMEVFNIAGEKVGSLVNDEKAAGYYTVDFNSTMVHGNLSSGVYIYRLEATDKLSGKNFISVKKMVLVK